jgi:hypothetical protein
LRLLETAALVWNRQVNRGRFRRKPGLPRDCQTLGSPVRIGGLRGLIRLVRSGVGFGSRQIREADLRIRKLSSKIGSCRKSWVTERRRKPQQVTRRKSSRDSCGVSRNPRSGRRPTVMFSMRASGCCAVRVGLQDRRAFLLRKQQVRRAGPVTAAAEWETVQVAALS